MNQIQFKLSKFNHTNSVIYHKVAFRKSIFQKNELEIHTPL